MQNFIVFIIVLFILAAVLRIDFFFTLVYLFAGVYLLSRFWVRRTLFNLDIRRQMQQRAFLGEEVWITLRLHNPTRLPVIWLLLDETLPIELTSPAFFREVVSLGSRSTYTVRYSVMAQKRGYYAIGPLFINTGDLLGVIRHLQGRLEADHLIVYPRIVPIAHLPLPTHSPQVVLPTPMPLFEDPSRMTGVRDYRQGDNPRHIHWPATASAGHLLVKQFQPAIARDNAIFLNLNRADYARWAYPGPTIELAITVAASLANHIIIGEELPAGLTAIAYDPLTESKQRFNLPPRKGRGHLMQILEALARVQMIETEETDFLESVRQESVHLSWGTTLIIITSHQSPELLQMLLKLKRTGFQVTLVLVESISRFTRQTKRPESPTPSVELGIPLYRIRQEKDIELWLPAT